MNRNLIIVIVVILALLAGGFLFLNSQKNSTSVTSTQTLQPAMTEGESASPGATVQGESQETLVTITSSSFSPKEVTIKVGQTIAWLNSDTKDHNISSDPHPTHTAYPPLNTIGLLKPNDKRSLLFTEKGTYKYHDHLNPQSTGIIIVE